MFVFLRKCFVLIVLFLFAAQSIAVGDTAPTPAATPTSTSSNEQPASSEGSGEADAKNSKPPAVKYVRFLDVLPEALDMDDNVRNASLSLRAAVESAKSISLRLVPQSRYYAEHGSPKRHKSRSWSRQRQIQPK